jgi:hypothetical protein
VSPVSFIRRAIRASVLDVITEIGGENRQPVSCRGSKASGEHDPLAGIAPVFRSVSAGRCRPGGGSNVRVEETSRVSAAPQRAPYQRHADACAEGFALVVGEGGPPRRRIAIGSAPIVIGRGVGVDLQIADPTVSRHHCVVWCIAGRCWVRDLGSTNPTRVNNRWSLVTEIFAGDVLLIGQTVLTLTRTPPSPDGTV